MLVIITLLDSALILVYVVGDSVSLFGWSKLVVRAGQNHSAPNTRLKVLLLAVGESLRAVGASRINKFRESR